VKSTSAAMDTALAGTSLRLSRCYLIQRRDATQFRFTDHDNDLVISGQTGDVAVLNGTYETVLSPDPSSVNADMELNVDNMEIQGPMAISAIDVDDIDAGLFDGADVWIFAVDWGDLSADIIRFRKGTIGEIKRFDDQYLFEVRGATQRLFEELTELYTGFCAADLGDSRCKINIEPSAWAVATAYSNLRTAKDALNEQGTPAAVVKPLAAPNDRWFIVSIAGTSGGSEPSWDTTIGNTTVDNTVTWETIRARVMAAVVATVTSNREFTVTLTTDAPDAFFTLGHCRFETGLNAGLLVEIKSWTLATKTVVCSLRFPFAVAASDTLTLFAGCNKTRDVCINTYDNIRNSRGFPDVPSQDEAFRTPKSPEGS